MDNVHLVLLPGLDGTGRLFKPFIEQFPSAENITVVSYPADRYIPYAQLQDYILSVIPKDKPLVVLGESYSGPAAIQLASQSGLDIRGIVLVATFARFPDSWLKSISWIMPLSLLIRLPIPEFLIRHYCLGDDTNPELVCMLRQVLRDNQPAVLARRARDVVSVDVIADLEKLTIPCLYIKASNDQLVPGAASVEIQSYLNNVNIFEIDGPHCILQTQPRQCFEIIKREFLPI